MKHVPPPSSEHGAPASGVTSGHASGASVAPITEADLHAWVDGQLPPARRAEVDAWLADQPDARARVVGWQRQNALLCDLLNPVLNEPLPLRLPLRRNASTFAWRGLAAGVAIAVASASMAWFARGWMDAAPAADRVAAAAPAPLAGFAHRAAIAHAVYSPDARRPVEIGGDQEQALVTWLTKRMGAEVKAPALSTLGYSLVGGRLLPGGSGPVAQFMYSSEAGQRLTLYVTPEGAGETSSFRFGREGNVNQFYWVDAHFGYALSGAADRAELMRVSQEVYRQLDRGGAAHGAAAQGAATSPAGQQQASPSSQAR